MSRAHRLVLLLSCAACPAHEPSSDGAGPTGGAAASTATTLDTTVATTSAASTTAGTSTTSASGSSSTASGHDDGSTTGTPSCRPHAVVMGYWPPTNEMLRPWSTNATQNPSGWTGENWEGLGYDVYAFFPEFPPDGDPTNDEIGDDGSVGAPEFDLRVDYQATSTDFWRIVDEHQPRVLVTTSRGGEIGWELEAVEGGHGLDNRGDAALDWVSDNHGDDVRPTQTSVDARTWAAITTYRQGATLPSQLPMQAIADATGKLALTDVVIDARGTSGNYLSGFLALHGLAYQSLHTEQTVAAGHIHVGALLPVADARTLITTTLRVVLEAHPAERVACR